MKHVREKCTDSECNETCFVCSVCGAYEGGLATECPGSKIHYEVQKAIHEGKIDFKNGKWIKLIINKKMNNYRIAKDECNCTWCKKVHLQIKAKVCFVIITEKRYKEIVFVTNGDMEHD